MKKWQFFLFLIICIAAKPVNAKVFQFEKNSNYQYKLTWINGNTAQTIYTNMYKITDSAGNLFYNMEPNKPIFTSQNYTLQPIPFTLEQMKQISKIIYYGYGYQSQIKEEYYAATQYLIFEALNVSKVEIIDENKESSNYAKEEIEEIRKTLQEHSTKINDYTTAKTNFVIKDPYLIKHYDVKGEKISVTKEEQSYNIELLEEEDEYLLQFISKNKCLEAEFWKNSASASVIGKSDLCEEDKTIRVIKEKTQETEEPKIEAPVEMEIPEVEKEIIVNVPNTFKETGWSIVIIVLIGNIYYVYKN